MENAKRRTEAGLRVYSGEGSTVAVVAAAKGAAEGREIKAMNDAARQVHRGVFNEWPGPRLRAPVTCNLDREESGSKGLTGVVVVVVVVGLYLSSFRIASVAYTSYGPNVHLER